jgi:cyclohexanone monooxygenase
MTTSEPIDVEVLVLGAGVCGIGIAATCLRAGIDDLVVIERADGVGGTWRHNTYPGCAVDVPSQLYSFSWAPRADWSRDFAPQAELLRYLEDVTDDTGVRPKLRLGTELLDARWEDADQRWHVTTDQGTYRARSFVSAAGPLHEPQIPDLPGRDRFTGPAFHSSGWRHDVDLTGQRVVVVGTGASALQFVPKIRRDAAQVTVLQRTASWVVPKPDRRSTPRRQRFLRRVPAAMRAARAAQWFVIDIGLVGATRHPRLADGFRWIAGRHLRRSVRDPDLRAALTPAYTPTCKRIGLSNAWFPAMASDNVELVTEAAASIDETGVVTASGRHLGADVIVWGTGFHTLQTHPINRRVHGRDGRSLEDVWAGNPTAYLGTTVAGFPNLFVMFGPNIGTVSGFVMAEAQASYVVGALLERRRRGLASIEVRPAEQAAFVAQVDRVLATSTFTVGGCHSYYQSDAGNRISLVWPWTMRTMRRRLRRFDLAPYDTTPEPAATARR